MVSVKTEICHNIFRSASSMLAFENFLRKRPATDPAPEHQRVRRQSTHRGRQRERRGQRSSSSSGSPGPRPSPSAPARKSDATIRAPAAAARNTRTAADGRFNRRFLGYSGGAQFVPNRCTLPDSAVLKSSRRRVFSVFSHQLRVGTTRAPVLKTACRRHAGCYFANALQHARHIFSKSGKSALSGLLVALVLLLNALAASPALHELVHKDADRAGHACAVMLFAHGQVDSVSGEIPMAVPLALIETTPSSIFSVLSTAIENLPPGRAPPAVISSQA